MQRAASRSMSYHEQVKPSLTTTTLPARWPCPSPQTCHIERGKPHWRQHPAPAHACPASRSVEFRGGVVRAPLQARSCSTLIPSCCKHTRLNVPLFAPLSGHFPHHASRPTQAQMARAPSCSSGGMFGCGGRDFSSSVHPQHSSLSTHPPLFGRAGGACLAMGGTPSHGDAPRLRWHDKLPMAMAWGWQRENHVWVMGAT